MSADLNRRDVLAGTIALGALGRIETARAQPSAPASAQQQASRSMTSYIGSPTSRVDGRAKVTGQAKYAGEFNVSGLAYGSVVGSTITKGSIARIDAGEALKVRGVLGVLTHESRPRMADNDRAYHDDAAPEAGAPFRPLYDDRIKFNGQSVAVVLAEE
jgi:xanthine dehydrogenase YagR molybdenum-binding subunit